MTLKEINELLTEIKEDERRYDAKENNCLANRRIKDIIINEDEHIQIIYLAYYRHFYKAHYKNDKKISEEIIKDDEIIFQLMQ